MGLLDAQVCIRERGWTERVVEEYEGPATEPPSVVVPVAWEFKGGERQDLED